MSGIIRRLAMVSAIAGLGIAGATAVSGDAQAQQQKDVQKQQNDFRIRAPGARSSEMRSQSTSMEKPSGQVKSQGARSSENVRAVQEALKQEGHDLKVDGIMGPQTREAIRKYQSEHGLKTTGTPDKQTMQQLGVAGQGAGSMGQSGKDMGSSGTQSGSGTQPSGETGASGSSGMGGGQPGGGSSGMGGSQPGGASGTSPGGATRQ